ncbi:RidA family protein [Leptolyngbya cf. ectocarpi LEGE 11479]|uniref:RidA family protein n=1 Tax=Leptolyngbya cf. ectocarpi LEGE 11479 TaxID=1828722 RepID=A0A929F793_LEPEC|nr:Rid family hydrolase [Leptolyngbya ectocarpi]MBE9068106.1 RidA family protein [Leptolyngbya cf. ectocarpi LEGE 11479]
MKLAITKIQAAGILSGLFTSGLLLTSVAAQESLKRALNPPALANSLQYGYSQATIAAPNAQLVHVAGQVGITEDGPNNFESQVDRAFDALAATLDVAGTDPDNVVKITLLIVDHDAEKLAYLVEKRKAFFGDNPPASTLIPVPELYAPGVLFEIDAVAVAHGSNE